MNFLTRTFLRLLPVALIGGFIALMFTSSDAVQTDRVEAINAGAGPGSAYTDGTYDTALSLAGESGEQYIRETIDWSEVETSEGVYDWSSWRPLDAIFTSEDAAGFTIVAVLEGAPSYLAGSDGSVDTTELLVAWANFVQTAVNQFGDRVDVWEIGSRVNSTTGTSPFLLPSSPDSQTTPDTDTYAKLVKAAAKIIKNADPNDEVWMGSLVSATSASCAVNPLTFMLEMNGTKAWNSIDSIQYRPERGAVSPESTVDTTNSACTSSLQAASTTLAGELQSVTDLARQLGGKTVRLEGLGWSGSEIESLSTGRSISSDEVMADYLTRASVIVYSGGKVTSIFLRTGLAADSPSTTALTNLNSVLTDAKFIGQYQGQSGSVYEYRFRKGSKWIIVAWRAAAGDDPLPVTLADLPMDRLTAYAVDAEEFSADHGTVITVDDTNSTTIMLNERPVVFIGYTSNLGDSAQQEVEDQLDIWKYELKAMARRAANNAKAAMMQALEDMFNSAKEQAIQWGEDKLDELLN